MNITEKELAEILKNPDIKVETPWYDTRTPVKNHLVIEFNGCRIFRVEMPYIGSCLSVNHYKYAGGRFTRKETKEWMSALGYEVAKYHLKDYRLPLNVRCDAIFKDKRSSCDLNNLAKVCCDAIMLGSTIDDKHFRWQDGNVKIDKTQSPKLILTISEAKND